MKFIAIQINNNSYQISYRFINIFFINAIIIVGILSLSSGAITISHDEIMHALLGQGEMRTVYIIQEIRLPRFIFAALAGVALAISGTALQGLFRNPLTDPSIIGISGGAAFFASFVIVFSSIFPVFVAEYFGKFLLAFFAFIGGLITTWLVYYLSNKGQRASIMTLLLTGLGINAFYFGAIGLLTYIADEQQLKQMSFWNLGSMGSSSWEILFITIPFVLISVIGIIYYSKQLNTLSLGENNAAALGVNVEKLSKKVIVLSALAVGIVTAFCGIISFVGIIVPHISRMICGPDHRKLIHLSILLGALFMASIDLASRTLFIPSELPINILTSFIGAPIFLYVLLRFKHQGFV